MNDARSRTLKTEAADWYARLRSPTVSEVEAARFRAWIASNPEHRREFEEIDTFWQELAALETSPEVHKEKSARAIECAAAAGVPVPRRSAAGIAALFGIRKLAAIGITAAAISGLLVYQYTLDQRTLYRTSVGEQRVVPLEDGSLITLNTSSTLRVDYSAALRRIELLGGQANFEVARDSARPFIVTVGKSTIRAIGTKFDVYKLDDKVTVTLIEGKVAVAPAIDTSDGRLPSIGGSISAAQHGEVILSAGEQVSYTKKSVFKSATANIERVSAWRDRKLNFADTPLAEAIDEANRYSTVKIELRADALREARISGVFSAGKNELFVEGLQSYFRLDVQRPAKDRIVLLTR